MNFHFYADILLMWQELNVCIQIPHYQIFKQNEKYAIFINFFSVFFNPPSENEFWILSHILLYGLVKHETKMKCSESKYTLQKI